MPDYYDPFNLVVIGSAEAIVNTENVSVGSGESFTMSFSYAGGFNPVATGFELNWYTTTAHQNEGLVGTTTNAITSGDSRLPTQIRITPRTPEAGAVADSSGELSGIAPVLRQGETRRTLYGVLTILQGALNVG